MGFPGTDWGDKPDDAALLNAMPAKRNWEKKPMEVRHIFTHFDLRLAVYSASVAEADMPEGLWASLADISQYALPSVMKKVLKAAL